MSKYITPDVLRYFPQFSKNTYWEKFVDQLKSIYNIELDFDAPIIKQTRVVKVTLYKNNSKWGSIQFSNEYWDDIHMDFEYDKIYEGIFNALKKAKFFRKPRNKVIQNTNEDKIKELKTQRSRLTTKIYMWEKSGKNTDELIKLKESLSQQINSLK